MPGPETPRSAPRLLFVALAISIAGAAPREGSARQLIPPPEAQDAFVRWPLPAGAEAYRDIDGRRIHRYVVEQAEISRRYRDQGHPKFWGRIIGTSADAESASWLADHFRRIGLSDVRIQNFDLAPQWFPGEYQGHGTIGEHHPGAGFGPAVLPRARHAKRWPRPGGRLRRPWDARPTTWDGT